jgi:alpha-amylase
MCRWGDDYWKVDFTMNCSQTVHGWFELKGFSTYNALGWEFNINQQSCGGTAGGITPFTSINHVARCGFTNVFEWEQNGCIIDNLE